MILVKVAIYVDTSGSMNGKISSEVGNSFEGDSPGIEPRTGIRGFMQRFRGAPSVRKSELAQKMWNHLVPQFTDLQTKIATINSRGKSVELGTLDFRHENELLEITFPRPGGGTYLWEFLVDEAKVLSQDSTDWLFFLISDGVDIESNAPYRGVDGFGPCIEAIGEMGIDVEFHIIGLGLPEDAVNVFRQVSGATGGSFVNISQLGEEIEEAIEQLSEALEESLNPIARMASRQRRQQEYLESRQDGDMELTTPISNIDSFEGFPYGEHMIRNLIPEETSQWQQDLLMIQGHENIEEVHEFEHWVSARSTPLFSETPGVPIDSWALSVSDLEKISTTDVNMLFTFLDQVQKSDVPEENRRIIIRGDILTGELLHNLRNSGARIVVYPEELPPPPPPDIEDEIWERNEYDFSNNPSRSWAIFPHLGSSKRRPSIVIDPPYYPEYVQRLSEGFSRKNLVEELQNEFQLNRIKRSYGKDIFEPSWNHFNDGWQPDQWPQFLIQSQDEVGEAFCESLRITYIQLVHEWLCSKGERPSFILVRLSVESKEMGLHKHPCYLQFIANLDDLFNDHGRAKRLSIPRFEQW